MKMQCRHLLLATVVLAGLAIPETSGYRILSIFQMNSKSHHVMFEGMMRALAERGHEVVVVSHFPLAKPIPNYTDLNLEGSLPVLVNNFTAEFARSLNHYNLLEFTWITNVEMCKATFKHPHLQKLLKAKDDKFDAVVTELFGVDCFTGFAHKYGVPLIGMTSSVSIPWYNDRIGNPDHTAYIPNYYLPFSSRMTFLQRLLNTVYTVALKLGYYYFSEVPTEALAREYFGDDLPPLRDIAANTSLILINSHFSLNQPRPTVPAFVEVGGLHIQTPKKLPQDLEKFISEAKHGVIYFNLGSLVKVETLPLETLHAIFGAFSKLPQSVVMKYGNDSLPGEARNIKFAKWLPQLDILTHPNVRVFFSHGGLMGTQEAVYAGVPIVGLPIFADQYLNIQHCQELGLAMRLDYDNITEESVFQALSEVLNNPSYANKARQLSTVFRDRPLSAKETAVYWVEYVIRHRGAHHLRSAAVELSWYQYLLLDVVAVILFALLAVLVTALAALYTTWYLGRLVCNLVCHRNTTEKAKKH